ncbi:MAG: hypothetical protein ACJAZ9_000055 [Neolewinella sp.]|jgi:hypothetical protein
MSLAFLPLFCPNAVACEASLLSVKGNPDWNVRRYGTEEELKTGWPEVKRADDFWLKPEVLAFQINNPQGLTTEVLVLENSKDHRRVMLTAQTFYFSAGGQVSDDAKGETSNYDFRRRLLSPFSFKILCLGQFLVSGDFASEGLKQLSPTEAATILPALANTLMACSASYVGVLIKDLYGTTDPSTKALENEGFYQLPVDPVMQMKIPEHWLSMEDYLADLKSKYRVRHRRARGKLEGITRRELSAREVATNRDRIYQLYKGTSSGADFNAAALTPEYFPWLAAFGQTKKRLSSVTTISEELLLAEFELTDGPARLHGYFNPAGELIGFTSIIANGTVLHAHFLGMEDAYKRSHHLYHNILFDLLEEAIDGGFETLDYARTAPEIKTSVGATARKYAVMAKARPWLINKLIPVFTPAVYKAIVWTARNPFR